MHSIRILLFIGFACFLLSSCKKEISDLSTQITFEKVLDMYASTDPNKNFITITSSQLTNYFDTVNSYYISVSGYFTKNGMPINIGPISINDRLIHADSLNFYEFDYNENNVLQEGKSLLGSTIKISASMPDAASQTEARLSVPKSIYSSSKDYLSSIDKAQNFELKWDVDPNNQFKKVQIELFYYKGISQLNAANMPDSVDPLVYKADDSGSYTVSLHDLENFPKGSYVGVRILRAACKNLYPGKMTCIAIVEAHTTPLLVKDSGH